MNNKLEKAFVTILSILVGFFVQSTFHYKRLSESYEKKYNQLLDIPRKYPITNFTFVTNMSITYYDFPTNN